MVIVKLCYIIMQAMFNLVYKSHLVINLTSAQINHQVGFLYAVRHLAAVETPVTGDIRVSSKKK